MSNNDENDSSASSTSTQWPSAPSSPDSQSQEDVSTMQKLLDQALHDPFSSHPDTTAHLKSNIKIYCQKAAKKIHSADVLLVVTGAGFSADSGLATYIDVADIDAYRTKGWQYRDLCKPPTFSTFVNNEEEEEEEEEDDDDVDNIQHDAGDTRVVEPSNFAHKTGEEVRDNGENNATGEVSDVQLKHPPHNDEKRMDIDEGSDDHDEDMMFTFCQQPEALPFPNEDSIRHPQFFYGFWGQCCNDYRRVKQHEGYDILAQWGKEKNQDSNEVAQEIRNITQMLEQGAIQRDSDSSDDSESFQLKEGDEDEPYYVSPTQRAGAFFVFTSNVDAHSYDVFPSHEIRECHGNVELWQCHNFACGTNDTTLEDRGSLGEIEGTEMKESQQQKCDGYENKQRTQKWQRRLWRLPMDHQFVVDCNTMQAPRSKAAKVTTKSANEPKLSSSPPVSPASKRRKSAISVQDDHDDTCVDFDSKLAACADHDEIDDTANALGGIMNYTLHNHLEKEVAEGGSQDSSDNINDESNRSTSEPAHVGDVHGKPRLFPLRHMHTPQTDTETETQAHDYFLQMTADGNWPSCPRCKGPARPAVLMFNDMDWVYNSKQEGRWQRWCESLLKLCKRRCREGLTGGEQLDSDSASTVSDTNISEKGWEDVSDSESPGPSTEHTMGETAKFASAAQTKETIDEKAAQASTELPNSDSDQQNNPSLLTNQPSSSPLKVAILEIGCGYNVPTCRVIAERLVCELTLRGGDATLIRINPSHPESDDHSCEDFVISIMEKGLVALKMIDEYYTELKAEASD